MAGPADRTRGDQRRKQLLEELRHLHHEEAPWYFDASLIQRIHRASPKSRHFPYRVVGVSLTILILAGAAVLWWEPISEAVTGVMSGLRGKEETTPEVEPASPRQERLPDTLTQRIVVPPATRQSRPPRLRDTTAINVVTSPENVTQPRQDTTAHDTVARPGAPANSRSDSTVSKRPVRSVPDTTRIPPPDTSSVGPRKTG
jgi:hypothetical protein